MSYPSSERIVRSAARAFSSSSTTSTRGLAMTFLLASPVPDVPPRAKRLRLAQSLRRGQVSRKRCAGGYGDGCSSPVRRVPAAGTDREGIPLRPITGGDAMKRILIGVDGSAESRKAAEYACKIAKATNSAVELAYVLPDITYSSPGPALSPQRWQEIRTDRAQLLLYEMSQSVPGPLTEVDTSLLEGSPADRLASEANRDDIWLVAVGHRGRGAVQRVLLGSVADRLVQISPKPVIVVR